MNCFLGLSEAGLGCVESNRIFPFSCPNLTSFQWNQPSIDFYEKKLGATAMSEWMGMRLEEDGIENLKSLG